MILGTFSFKGLLARWWIALVLVMGTINPSGFSYFHWVSGPSGFDESPQLKLLVGAFMVIGYIVYWRATLRSIRLVGVGLGVFIVALGLWYLSEKQWIDLTNPTTISWSVLFSAGTIMGFGLSWSHIRRIWSGQVDSTQGGWW